MMRVSRGIRIASAFLSLGAVLAIAQTRVRLAYECTEEDVDAFGLTCTMEQPCPVYVEIASVDGTGNRIVATGNLHTSDRTLYSVVMMSEDGGLTWSEPHARLRSAALEQIEFLDLQTGWISGVSIDPLPRNPFFLLTTDGGKIWRQKLVFDDARVGTVAQFHFTSKSTGQFVLDASRGKTIRQELYESHTGGESWEAKQTSNSALRLANPRPPRSLNWRARADAATQTYRLERGAGSVWEPIADVAIHVTDCK